MTKPSIEDLPLYDVSQLFGASKSSDYRSRVLLRGEALAHVFTEYGLTKTNLLNRFVSGLEQFQVTLGDLTERGYAFSKVHFQRWLANTDRWKGGVTLEKLKNSLEAQLRKFSGKQP